MADMAMVLEGASAAGVQVGKQEVIAAGPAGRGRQGTPGRAAV